MWGSARLGRVTCRWRAVSDLRIERPTVYHSVTTVIADDFLSLLSERWGLFRHSSKGLPFIAYLL